MNNPETNPEKKGKTQKKEEESKKEIKPADEKSVKENSKQNASTKKEASKRNSYADTLAIFQTKKPQDNKTKRIITYSKKAK